MEERPQEISYSDIYTRRFLNSPVYVMVIRDTLDTAAGSYQVARILSVISFFVGIGLIVVGILFGFLGFDYQLSLIFAGLGVADFVALLLYRPIDRIQSGVNDLIKSQIACLSFLAQYDSISRYLATTSELPLDDENRDLDLEIKRANNLMNFASSIVALIDNTEIPTDISQIDYETE